MILKAGKGGVRHKEHWNPPAQYILGEVNTGCPSKVGSALLEEKELLLLEQEA